MAGEQRFRRIFENMQIPCVEVSLNGIIQEVSPSVEKYLMYKREELIGMSILDLYAVPGERETFIKELLDNGELSNEHVRVRDKDDRITQGLIYAKLDQELQTITASFIPLDRSDTPDAQQQLQKADAISTFAGGIVHSFNNILSTIVGNAEFALRHELEEDAPGVYSVRQIVKAVDRAGFLTRQILALSRWKEPEPSLVNLNPLIKEIVKFLKATVSPDIRIQLSLKAGSDIVKVDPVVIHQALMSLCAQGLESMRSEGGELKILLTNVGNGGEQDMIELSVTWCTATIPNQSLEDFMRAEKHGQIMASVRNSVVEMNGQLLQEFDEQTGCCYRILLPQYRAPEEKYVKTEDKHAGGSERILFVDDDEQIVELIVRSLEVLGYNIVGMSNPTAALALFAASSDSFDILVSDLNMDEMMGDRLVQKCRSIRRDFPVIICSGHDEMVGLATGANPEINAVIRKPFMIDELDETIRRVLNESKNLKR